MSRRTEITVDVPPWLRDHHLDGRVVFPAVETLLLLAAVVEQDFTGCTVRIMEEVRFARFLEIPAQCMTFQALVECESVGRGAVRARLLSRVRLKTMSRLVVHGEVLFPAAGQSLPKVPDVDAISLQRPVCQVHRQRIYRHLVPFGPTYQTLRGNLSLSGRRAWGHLRAPELPLSGIAARCLGSPFPLDGAMHAACVHGQQRSDFVPFPVAFSHRIVHRPTAPGQEYAVRVHLVDRQDGELVYDLLILDLEGEVYETVRSLRMRDVGLSVSNRG